MSRYIIDASVAAKWVFPEVHSEDARAILGKGHRFFVPDFFYLETDNIVCKRLRRRQITNAEAERVRRVISGIPVTVETFRNLSETAFRIAAETGRSLYDCLYLAQAVKFNGVMVTADRKFYRSLSEGPLSDYLIWVGDS